MATVKLEAMVENCVSSIDTLDIVSDILDIEPSSVVPVRWVLLAVCETVSLPLRPGAAEVSTNVAEFSFWGLFLLLLFSWLTVLLFER